MFEKEAEEYSNNWKINKNNDLNFAELVELRAVIYKANKDGAEFGYNKAKEEMQEQIEKMKCCEICAKSKDWRNRGICIECKKSKSHINFELRRG